MAANTVHEFSALVLHATNCGPAALALGKCGTFRHFVPTPDETETAFVARVRADHAWSTPDNARTCTEAGCAKGRTSPHTLTMPDGSKRKVPIGTIDKGLVKGFRALDESVAMPKRKPSEPATEETEVTES